MDALLPMLINVLIFVALALPGYILVKTKIIKSSDSASLSKLLTYVALPFMIFVGAQNINLSGDFLALAGITTVAGIAITVGCFFLSKPLAMKRLFNKNSNNETESEETVNTEKSRGVMRFAMAFSNNGFLGIPLAVAVFSGNAQIQAIVIILNIIPCTGLTDASSTTPGFRLSRSTSQLVCSSTRVVRCAPTTGSPERVQLPL